MHSLAPNLNLNKSMPNHNPYSNLNRLRSSFTVRRISYKNECIGIHTNMRQVVVVATPHIMWKLFFLTTACSTRETGGFYWKTGGFFRRDQCPQTLPGRPAASTGETGGRNLHVSSFNVVIVT